ncbi:YbaK/EbsC family protein [Amycolatopsis taiwanensis]|uniref:Aminoacyl-tRNA deacylase n=1 Tax=Amycolatopsis taiwanensis TaxID=342230 RepID=A0A9W6VGR5_9PSEU|nr:YbaK/EbsC family protein [Amycolatopsis taiwanensis]GLY66264.1 aminoacyl-tRNA deacylase [Amycolatopsis taiwanensis]
MSSLDHPAVAKVAAALAEAGQPGAADGIRILPAEVRTAAQAAEALGVPVGAIANSLVFRALFGEDSAPLLAMTSGAHRAAEDRLAELAGASAVAKADPKFVKEHTGQVIGGVAPIGHPRPLTTLVDTALEAFPVIWAAAGHAKSVFPTTFADLLALTGGRAAELGS